MRLYHEFVCFSVFARRMLGNEALAREFGWTTEDFVAAMRAGRQEPLVCAGRATVAP